MTFHYTIHEPGGTKMRLQSTSLAHPTQANDYPLYNSLTMETETISETLMSSDYRYEKGTSNRSLSYQTETFCLNSELT
jgi:hypothetical protein